MGGVKLNPYAGIDWDTIGCYVGSTHMHPDDPKQGAMDDFYGVGTRVMAWSGYYPETPTPAAAFTSVPGDVILVDNSEQHDCTDSLLHFCPLGSTYSNDGGTGVPWRDAFDAALALLEDPDGGGITLNHPAWSSSVKDPTWLDMLDHDPRVLGIEVRNHMTINGYAAPRNATDYDRWDRFLATGRRVWGFWAHDHYVADYAPYLGFNMLLLEAGTPTAALRAYRNGAFYGSLTRNLALTRVSVSDHDDHDLTITTDSATTIRMICPLGIESKSGSSATFKVPDTATHARFEADNALDTIYTQPVLYDVPSIDPVHRRRRLLLGI